MALLRACSYFKVYLKLGKDKFSVCNGKRIRQMRHVKTFGRRRETRVSPRQVETRKLLGLVPYGTGSLTVMADAIGVTPQAISHWKKVPVQRVAQVEKVTGIPRHLLRPDVFDAPTNTDSKIVSTSV
jgi:hypothetical protein